MSAQLLHGLSDAGQLLMQLAARHEYAPLHFARTAPLTRDAAELALTEVQERGLLRPAEDAPHVLLLTPVGYALRDTVKAQWDVFHPRLRSLLLEHVFRRFELPPGSRLRSALAAVDRANFLPEINRPLADLDLPAPLAVPKATTSAPHAIAAMLQALEPTAAERVLICGIKGGVTAALCAHMVGPEGHVMGVDNSRPLVNDAARALRAAGSTGADVVLRRVDDVTLGAPEEGPWHVVVLNGSVPKVPLDLVAQLHPERGRLLLFLQEAQVDGQRCYLLHHDGRAEHQEGLSRFVFTPIFGRWGWDHI